SIKVTWDPVLMAEGYKLYYSTQSSVYSAKEIDVGANTAYTLSGLESGTTYYFWVKAYGYGDESGNSDRASAATSGEIVDDLPNAPANLGAVAGDSSAILYWDPVEGADSYQVYWYYNNEWMSIGDPVTETERYMGTLTNSATYTFAVTAVADGVESELSAPVYVMPIVEKSFYDAPVIRSAAASGSDSIKVTWDPVLMAEGYKLYYSTQSSVYSAKEIDVGANTAYTLSGLESGTTYYFWVKAYGYNDESGYSDSVSAATESAAAEEITVAPNNLKVSTDYTSAYLTWDKVNGADGYKIVVQEGDSGSLGIIFPGSYDYITTDNFCNVTGLKSECSYIFTVYAYNSISDGPQSKVIDVTKTVTLSAPVISSVKVLGNDSVKITWDPVSMAEGYWVYNNTSNTINGALHAYVDTETSFTVDGLESGTTYYFWVKAYGYDKESDYSDSVSAVTASDPAEDEIAINAVNFPDSVFRSYVSKFDTDGNGYFSDSECRSVLGISVFGQGISDLKGIEYFTEITRLDCDKNNLTSLDVSKNTKLVYLYCSENKLTKLDVSKNTALKSLYCYNNQLSALDLSNNAQLNNLSCGGNGFSYTDLTGYYIYVVNNIPSSRTVLTAAEMRAVEYVIDYDYSK
ncbi:MAG: fibronectin type III domain-containing protein, partial [Oscillospiraceae bacterium]|nr:fibronectin type III domain-containing protein [Oscillospiraceae bacterium]